MAPPSSTERDARFKDLINLLYSVKSNIFDPFHGARTQYDAAGTPIEVDILVPKNLPAGPRPVIVRIHGGFLITGSSLFPAWFSKWILDFAVANGAIIVSPNYRLLPEVRGKDILQDIQHFWKWYNSGDFKRFAAAAARSRITLDMERLLLVGESAESLLCQIGDPPVNGAPGGYLAVQSILARFIRPKALITLYPMLDMRADYYTKAFDKPICGVPNYPSGFVDEFLSSRTGAHPITEAEPPDRLDHALAVVQNGRLLDLLGDEVELFPLERIRDGNLPPPHGNETLMPPLYILHGAQDSAVPVEGTLTFVKLLMARDLEAKIHLVVRNGDHGFDAFATTQDPWMREGLDFIALEWLNDGKSRI